MIGLLLICTGKYTEFLDPVIESYEKYFCSESKKIYFILLQFIKETNGLRMKKEEIQH